jgi:pimeloyl-ACP methyl ester carboxylesterase
MRILSAISLILIVTVRSASIASASQINCKNLLSTPSWSLYNPTLPFSSGEISEIQAARKQLIEDGNRDINSLNVNGLVHVAFENDLRHRTLRMIGRNGRVPEDSKARILVLHGNGTSRSRAFTMATIVRFFSGRSQTTKTMNLLRQGPDYIPVAAESIDAPGCGVGPGLHDFKNIDDVTNWLASYIIDMRRATPDLPLILFTRSSSAALAMSVAKKYPGLIDGLVLMSPTLPGNAEIIDAGARAMYEYERQQQFVINGPGLQWIDRMLKQIPVWTPEYFGDRRVFILTGDHDDQMVNLERETYKRIADTQPNVKYTAYPAPHEVVSTSEPNRAVGQGALADVLKFIRDVIEGRPIK